MKAVILLLQSLWIFALVKFFVISVVAKDSIKKNSCQNCVNCSHSIAIGENLDLLFNNIHQEILNRLFSLHNDIEPQQIPVESVISVITGVLRQFFPNLFGDIDD